MKKLEDLQKEISNYKEIQKNILDLSKDFKGISESDISEIPVHSELSNGSFTMSKSDYLRYLNKTLETKRNDARRCATSIGIQYEELPLSD